MFENGPSDRMQFVGMGELTPPGTCMVCGNGTCEKGYVRLGVYYEYEGEMYLCWFCAAQTAEIIGCLLPEEADELRSFTEDLARSKTLVEEELSKANERLTAFDLLFSGAGVSLNADNVSVGVPVSEEPENTLDNSDESPEGPASFESESAKPVTQRRRSNPKQPAKPNGSDAISI